MHYNSFVKKKKIILFPWNFSLLSLIFFVLFSFSHLLSPLFKSKHHPSPNINITHHSGSFFLVGCDPVGSMGFFFFWRCDQCLKEEVGSGSQRSVWVTARSMFMGFCWWVRCWLWVDGGGFGCVDGGGWMRVLILVGLMVVVVG